MLVTIEHSNCFITTLQIALIHSRIVATSEIKCQNQTISFLTLRYLIIAKIKRSWLTFCDVTITGVFRRVEKQLYMQAAGPESAIDAPFS